MPTTSGRVSRTSFPPSGAISVDRKILSFCPVSVNSSEPCSSREESLQAEVTRLQRELEDLRKSHSAEIAALRRDALMAGSRREIEERILRGIDSLNAAGRPPRGFFRRLIGR